MPLDDLADWLASESAERIAFQRRVKVVLAMVVLAVAVVGVAVSVALVALGTEGRHRREELARGTRAVAVLSCRRQNEHRRVERRILHQFERPDAPPAVHVVFRRARAQLRPVDCVRAKRKIPVE